MGNSTIFKDQITKFTIIGIFLVFFSLNSVLSINHEKMNVPNIKQENIIRSETPSNFLYWEPISIIPATPVANYTIRVDLNSTFNYARCRPNGEDVRFFDTNNNSLSYWIEKWNINGNSTIWVNIPKAGTSNMTISYGNNTISPASNGDKTFVFFDDFSGTSINSSKWTVKTDAYSTVSVGGGVAVLTSNPPSDSYASTYMGFLNHYVDSGVIYMGQSIEATNNNLLSRSASGSQATTYDFLDKWVTFEFRWFSTQDSRFFANDTFIAQHPRSGYSVYPPVNPVISLPVRFLVTGTSYPSSTSYGAYISSNNTVLGQPGYALRTSAWNHHANVGYPATPSKIRIHWIFVRKCVPNEPVTRIFFGYHHKPTLTSGHVSPSNGNQTTPFNFTVIYTDADNNAPATVNVVINGTTFKMNKQNPSDTNYTDGCLYEYITVLRAYNYMYSFTCNDSFFTNSAGPYSGPNVIVTNVHAPRLTNGQVTPTSASSRVTPFTFTINYTDADNNEPVQITVKINSSTHSMTKQNPADNNYLVGCIYTFTTTLNQSGNYMFNFQAFDGIFNTTTTPQTMPLLTFPPVDENFETYNINDPLPTHPNWHNIGSLTYIPTAVAHSGSMQGHFFDWSTDDPEDCYMDCPPGSGLDNWNVNFEITWIASRAIISIADGPNATTGKLLELVIGNVGTTGAAEVQYYNLGGYHSLTVPTTLTSGQQYLIKIHKHSSAPELFDIFIDGVQKGVNIPCWNQQVTNVTRFWTTTELGDPYAEFYLDNIDFSWTPNLHPPVLSNLSVTPTTGNQSVLYNFTAVYSDADNNPAAYVNVIINGSVHSMVKENESYENYIKGCVYQYSTYLQDGTYNYYFRGNDGTFSCTSSIMTNLKVTYSNTHPPSIRNCQVMPVTGYNTTNGFLFVGNYSDPDNNPPAWISVTIDGMTHPMAKMDNSDTIYIDGCLYGYTMPLSVGTHSFYFNCSDGVFTASAGPFVGPYVKDPSSPILPGGLVLFYPLEGNAKDYSGHKNDGIAHNVTYGEGYVGEAAILHGNGYIDSLVLNSNTNYTLCAVINANTLLSTGSLDCPIFDSFIAGHYGTGFGISSGGIEILYNDGWIAHPFSFQPGQWYFVAVSFDRLNSKITSYVNGMEIQESSVNFSVESSFGRFKIGSYLSNNSYFDGMIDEVRVYNKTLSASEIIALWNSFRSFHCPTLTGETVIPNSGNQGTHFNFSVTYTDKDNNQPVNIDVVINNTVYPMEKVNSSDVNYTAGRVYQLLTYLTPGNYSYFMQCSDGTYSNSTTTHAGLIVHATNLYAPSLIPIGSGVNHMFGYTCTLFTFSVNYTDLDNNPPLYVYVNINGTPHVMAQQDPIDRVYIDGCVFIYSTMLGPGYYNFQFNTSDGLHNVFTSIISGLTVKSTIDWSKQNLAGVRIGIVLLGGSNPYSLYPKVIADLRARNATLLNVTSSITRARLMQYDILWMDWGGPSLNSSQTDDLLNWIQTGGSVILTDSGWGTGDFVVRKLGIGIWQNGHSGSYTSDIFDHPITVNVYQVYLGNWGSPQYTLDLSIGSQPAISCVMSSGRNYVVAMPYGSGKIVMMTEVNVLQNLQLADNRILVKNSFGWLGYKNSSASPVISNYGVNPPVGFQNNLYNFSMEYSQAGNNVPSFACVIINGTWYYLAKENMTDNNYTDGCMFQFLTYFQPGTYIFSFKVGYWIYNASTTPAILVVHKSNNFPPTLTNPALYPSIGYNGTTAFNFTVTYTDLDNNKPQYVNLTLTYSVFLHKTINYTINRALIAVNPNDNNYMDGNKYSLCLSFTDIANYSYIFLCSDGTFNTTIGPYAGPEVDLYPVRNYYLVRNYNYNWHDAAAGGLPYGSSSKKWHLPFNFTFYNDTFDYIYISFYGFATFIPNTETECTTIPTSTKLLIAPFWWGGIFSGLAGGVYVKNFTGPSSVAITWYSVSFFGFTTGDFELVIYQSGDIVFNYRGQINNGVDRVCGLNYGFNTAIYNTNGFPYSYSTYSVLYTRRPCSNIPPDIYLNTADSKNYNITWKLFTPYSAGTYQISRNSTVVRNWQPWPGIGTDINVTVNRSIGIGCWVYKIEYNDDRGTPGFTDTVRVYVNDIPAISGGSGINNTRISRNATGYVIGWMISDSYPGKGMYCVLLNGSSYIPWTRWRSGAALYVPVLTNIGCHTFNYTIRYHDDFDEAGPENHVIVRILDVPLSNHPADMIIMENETGITIDWVLDDSVGGGFYTVYINGEQYMHWTNWTTDVTLHVPVRMDLGPGVYVYTIHYNDSRGIFGADGQVVVTIDDYPVITALQVSTSYQGQYNKVYDFPSVITVGRGADVVISWTGFDHFGAGNYLIMDDAGVVVHEAWAINASNLFIFDTNRPYGTYNLSLIITDNRGNHGNVYHLTIIIKDPSEVYIEQQPGMDETLLYIVVGLIAALGIVVVLGVVKITNRKKKKSKELKKETGKQRYGEAMAGIDTWNLGDESTSESKRLSEGPVLHETDGAKKIEITMMCPQCNEILRFGGINEAIDYHCPKCDVSLKLVFTCPRCLNQCALSQADYKIAKVAPIQCPSCGETIPQ